MANPQHLDLLEQCVEARTKQTWNQWGKEHTDVRPDLFGAKLYLDYLRGFDLSEAVLFQANLSGAKGSKL